MQKKPNQKQITKPEYSSDFIRAYLHARRTRRSGGVEVVVVKDQFGQPICYGQPCEWPAGIAARVMLQEYKVEVQKYYSKEEQKQSEKVSIGEAKDELEIGHPGELQKSSQSEADLKFMRTVCYGVAAEKGVRTHMEDEHTIIKEFDLLVPKKKSSKTLGSTRTGLMSYYGVYDGHRGREASQFCRDQLHLNIAQEIQQESDILEAIKRGCLQTDKEFLQRAKDEDLVAGAVLVVTVLHGKELYVANAGDCRAVLCRAGRAVEITQDHRPTRLEEKLRVESVGGTVEFGFLNGDLEVSRAVGDRDETTGEKLKGLTAEPEAHKIFITDDDEFLLLACDGLFEAFSSEDAIKIARHSLEEDNDVQKAANDLVSQALRRSEDNVTAMIIGFNRLATDGSIYIVPSTEQELSQQRKARDEPRTKKISTLAIATLLSEIEEAKVVSPCSSLNSSPCPSPLPSETASPHSSPSPASTPSPSRSSVSSLSSRGRVSSIDLSSQFSCTTPTREPLQTSTSSPNLPHSLSTSLEDRSDRPSPSTTLPRSKTLYVPPWLRRQASSAKISP